MRLAKKKYYSNISKFFNHLRTASRSHKASMSKELDGLSSDDGRRFRLCLLNLYAAGEVAVSAAAGVTLDTSGGVATYYDASDAAGMEMMRAVGYAVQDTTGYALHAAGDAAEEIAERGAKMAAEMVKKKGGTVRQITHASCLSVIFDRKKIYDGIAVAWNEKFPRMATDKVVKCCITMMTFSEEQFTKLQLTIPLKMLDYLLGYQQAISFLRSVDVAQYQSLMKIMRDWSHAWV